MKRPSFTTYALGNAVVAYGTVGLTLLAGYAWSSGRSNGDAALIGMIAAMISLSANRRLQAYARWKQAWDGMAEASTPSSKRRMADAARVLAAAFIAILWLSLFSQRHDPNAMAGLTWLSVALFVMAMVAARRRRRRAQQRTSVVPKDHVVAISLGAPPIELPPLQVAYHRLPEHCLRVLGVSSTTSSHGPLRKPQT